MKSTIPSLLVVCLVIGTLAQSQEPAAVKKSITVSALNEMDVIGKLGIPLGEVVEVQAVIVSGSKIGAKELEGKFLLRIESINDKSLEKPTVERFRVLPFSGAEIANDHFDLYELKTGKKTGRLDSNQIKELEKDYVSKKVKLLVYESGSFEGMPNKLPDDAPLVQATDFRFRTHLMVLKQRG